MADGTNVVEPLTSTTTTITTVDSKELDYGAGDLRDRQRLMISSGKAPFIGAGTDAAVLAVVPADTDAGLVARLARSLTERMFAKAPAAGYSIWLDTADVSFIYTLEAPDAAAAGSTGFRGVRVTKDTLGNPVGKVQQNTAGTLTFTNRASDTGWA